MNNPVINCTVNVRVTKYPIYAVKQARHKENGKLYWVVVTQRWAKASWKIVTINDKVNLYEDIKKATKIARWFRDPEGTRSEWDTPSPN